MFEILNGIGYDSCCLENYDDDINKDKHDDFIDI